MLYMLDLKSLRNYARVNGPGPERSHSLCERNEQLRFQPRAGFKD